MGNTANLQLPYPAGTDAPYAHLDIQALAEALDTYLVATRTRSKRNAGTATGNLTASSVVTLAGELTIPANPLGVGVPYTIDLYAQTAAQVPSGGGLRLELQVNAATTAYQEETQAGATATVPISARDLIRVADPSVGRTVRARVTSLAVTSVFAVDNRSFMLVKISPAGAEL